MKEYKTISEIAGPLVFVKKTEPVSYNELVSIQLSDGSVKRGQVLDTSKDIVVVQVFEGTEGISRESGVKFLGETIKMPVSKDMLGRILSGSGDPLDGGPAIIPDKRLDIVGAAINPYSRFERTGALERAVVFMNLADDPAIERIITPRLALTTAEYLAFEHDMHVLVIYTDMTNYCEALRQIGAAREEVPGRRGYPGYMYTDLAMNYERAGMIHGKKGSITQVPILTMPGDDITHPIPDLTGYITEGQIVVARDLHRKGIYPPINVSPSLSRLMNLGIGPGKTREDHKAVSDQCYSAYAEGKDLRGLVAIVGKDALSERDKKFLEFADLFEDKLVRQSREEDRTIEQTLDMMWDLLATLPVTELNKIDNKYIEKYHPARKAAAKAEAPRIPA